MPTGRTRPHLCLVPRALTTVEHIAVVARQAAEEGLEVCWIDLGDEPGLADVVRTIADPGIRLEPLGDAASLRRHLKRHRSVATWIQSPYPEHYPAWFWPVVDGAIAYSGYGLTLSTWEDGLFGVDTYRKAAWLLTESERERDGYLRHGVAARRVLAAGNPLLYDLRRRLADAPEPRHDVLWAPHWTDDWFGRRGFARWRETVPVLLDHARADPGFRLRVRPHPLLAEAVADTDRRDDASVAYRELVALPGVSVSDGRFLDDVVESAALLTEGVSIIAYWAATGRPLGVVRDAESPGLNTAGEALVAAADRLDGADATRAWLDGLPHDGVDEHRRSLSELVHPTFDRSPVAIWNRDGRLG